MSAADTLPVARWERTIGEGFAGQRPLEDAELRGAVEGAVASLDSGELRVCSPPANEGGEWVTHAWLKQAILLYFRMHVSGPVTAGELEFFDKVPLKRGLERAGVRVVPPGVARYGSFLEKGVILSDEEILGQFYDAEEVLSFEDHTAWVKLSPEVHNGAKVADDVKAPKGKEPIVQAGRTLNPRTLDKLVEAGVTKIPVKAESLVGRRTAGRVVDSETGEALAETNQEITATLLAQIMGRRVASFKLLALAAFVVVFLLLGYLGVKPTTVWGQFPDWAFLDTRDVATWVARVCTIVYFLFFFLMPWYTARDKVLPVPERVTA